MMGCTDDHMLNNFESNLAVFDFNMTVSCGVTERISFSFQGKPLIT